MINCRFCDEPQSSTVREDCVGRLVNVCNRCSKAEQLESGLGEYYSPRTTGTPLNMARVKDDEPDPSPVNYGLPSQKDGMVRNEQ